MNRIILIGNGFDLAQGLNTSYKDFIDDYWDRKTNIFQKAYSERKLTYSSNDDYVYEDSDIFVNQISYFSNITFRGINDEEGFEKFACSLAAIDDTQIRNLHFKNKLLGQITEKEDLKNWVDIEQEYYTALLQCLESNDEKSVATLNKEFLALQKALEKYLTDQTAIDKSKYEIIYQKIYYPLNNYGELIGKEEEKYDNLLFLNFNYTNNVKLNFGLFKSSKLINIHGELNNTENTIIFGYGDDIDEKYKSIEQLNNNDYLKNMKSIKYSLTRNYQELLAFIESDEYHIYVMGHSCGISDRTLLNKLFEHNNCKSIKPFYYKKEDGTDNYMDLSINISRNFNDKSLFRERIVNKLDCEPLL